MEQRFYVVSNNQRLVVAGFMFGSEAQEYADHKSEVFQGKQSYTVLASHLVKAMLEADQISFPSN